jgi:hypothetical protein
MEEEHEDPPPAATGDGSEECERESSHLPDDPMRENFKPP